MDGTECLSSKNMQGIWLISKSEMLNLEFRWSENFEGTSNLHLPPLNTMLHFLPLGTLAMNHSHD